MSIKPLDCPGCLYGGSHLKGCPNDEPNHGLCVPPGPNLDECAPVLNQDPKIPPVEYKYPDVQFVTGTQVTRPEPVKVEIIQKIVPSVGTKLVCTTCGKADWHTLVLRRKAGLIEGLCIQEDGSGCYPNASRRNCQYTYPDQIDCPKLAEYIVAVGKERLNPRAVCRDHVGELLRQGPLYQVWPLED